jgi:hypothetical protein
MAQTKKKRRSKHRGNAAGVIEARGRTGRKPTAEEIKRSEKESAAQARRDRMNRAPTWRSATTRAALAALVFGALTVVLFKYDPVKAIGLTAFVFVFYVPLGYYTDRFVYNRRQKLPTKRKSA